VADEDNGGVSGGDNQPEVDDRRAGKEGRGGQDKNKATQGRITLGSLTAGWLLCFVLLLLLWYFVWRNREGGEEVPGGTSTS
jgi:hypothetical protein